MINRPILQCILFLIGVSFSAIAQTPSVTVYYPPLPACQGSIHRIPVKINGSFDATNSFSVQVKEAGSSSILATVPAALKGDNLEVIYRDSTLSLLPMLQFRVVSSSPVTESGWTSFKVHSKGIIRLSAAISDTVNLGEELLLKFTTLSSTEVDITLNDGHQLEISPYSFSEFNYYHTIGAHTTDPFYIRTATNSCGAMLKDGEVRPVINPTSVRTKSADALNACENGEIRIALSTMGPSLEPGPKYRVRFIPVLTGFTGEIQTMEASAELRDGWIVTRVPGHLNLQDKQNFKLSVLSREQGIVGAPGDFMLTVHPKPSVSFYTPDIGIDMGEETRVGVIFKGVPPFSAQLGDGTDITADYSGEVYLYKSPDKTTTYSIRSMSSGCGITELPVRQDMTVSVNEGIALVPESYPVVLCAGTKARVRIRSNGNFGAGTSYTVQAYYYNHRSQSFPATRNGDYLEFMIPELPAGTDPSELYDGLYHLSVISQNPALQSSSSYVYQIQSRPQVVPFATDYTFDEPGIVTLRYQLYGKPPFTIEDETGNRTVVKNDWWAPEVYLDKTKDFGIKSISNSCYTTGNIPSTRITLTNNTAPGLYLEPIPSRVCATDSLELKILAPGKFSDDNEFQIQAYADCCDFKTLKTVREGGTYKVKIPESRNGYTYPVLIKVISTHPFLTSETYQFFADTPLKDFTVRPAGTEQEPVLLPDSGDQVLFFSATGGGMQSLIYSDGTEERNVVFENPDDTGIPFRPAPGRTTVYTLKSMTNSCGTQTANIATHIRGLPYEIRIADFDFTVNRFCAGNQVLVPFAVTNGKAGNATFGLEISRADEVAYRTIASGERSGIVRATLPADLPEGNYKVRVVSSDGVASNTAWFILGVLPGATISSDLPQPITISSGGFLELDVRFTGTSPWTAVFEDGTSLSSNHDVRRAVYPTTGKLFGLKAVYNQCGYGTVSGSVEVRVPVYLTVSADSYAACKGKNYPVTYELHGDAELKDEYIRFELVDQVSSRTIPLDSTKTRKGTINLKIPADLTGSSYLLRTTYRKAGLTEEFLIFMTSPVEVTISGNTTINSGDKTILVLRTNHKISEIIDYELSDGTKGKFHSGSADSYITVNPDKTTTYTLTSVSNSCGAGTTAGSATVEVNPPSARMVSVTSFAPLRNGFCVGDSIVVNYAQTGTFTDGNVMTVQLSDTTGKNFRSIPTAGKTSPLRALLPADLFPGKPYRIRVMASDPGTAGGAHQSFLFTGEKAGARFESDVAAYKEGVDPVVVVFLSGTGPWQYDIFLDSKKQTIYSSTAVSTIYLQQALPGQVYRLQNVYGQCGPGNVLTPATITVTSILGTAEESVGSRVIISPNPARDHLLIRFETALPRNITVVDSRGITVLTEQVWMKEEKLDIRNLSSGVYLLSIEENGERRVYRVVKY